MPTRDLYHEAVRNALTKDGWTITHDPLRLSWGGRLLYVDLGAERLLGAERAGQRIAVEIKSFVGASPVADLERAIGQYVVYRAVLAEQDPGREIYLAVPRAVLQDVFAEPLGQLLLKNQLARLVGFDPGAEEVVQWVR